MGILDTLARAVLPPGSSTEKGIGKDGALISPFMGPNPALRSGWSVDNAVRSGYATSEWVKACVDAIAIPASTVPWRVSKFASKEAKAEYHWHLKSVPASARAEFTKAHRALEPLPNHPLETLLERPNPFFSRMDMMERFVQSLLLGGNGLWHINRGATGGEPLELWPVDPDGIKVHPAKNRAEVLEKYSYEKGEVKEDNIPPEDIFHVMLPDPSNPLWGISVLKSVAATVDTDVEAIKFNRNLLSNMAAVSGILTFKRQNARPLGWEEFYRARDQLEAEYTGSKNAGRPMILGNEAGWIPLSLSPDDMNLIESRKMNRESIAAAFRVHLAVLGFGNNADSSGLETALRWHWINTVIPYLDRITSLANLRLAPEFEDDILVWYDTSNVEALKSSRLERVNAAKVLWTMGVPFHIVNDVEMLGYPNDIPGASTGYLPASGLAIVGDDGDLRLPEGMQQNQPNQGNPNSAPDGGRSVTGEGGDSTQEGPKPKKPKALPAAGGGGRRTPPDDRWAKFAGLPDEERERRIAAVEAAEERWGWAEPLSKNGIH